MLSSSLPVSARDTASASSARRKGHGRSEQQFPADSPPLFPETTRTLFGEPDAICALNERTIAIRFFEYDTFSGSQRSFLRNCRYLSDYLRVNPNPELLRGEPSARIGADDKIALMAADLACVLLRSVDRR